MLQLWLHLLHEQAITKQVHFYQKNQGHFSKVTDARNTLTFRENAQPNSATFSFLEQFTSPSTLVISECVALQHFLLLKSKVELFLLKHFFI